MNDKVIPIHNSDQAAFNSCRRRWDLTSILRQGYRPHDMPLPLEFGICMHVGYQTFYDPMFQNVDIDMRLAMAQAKMLEALDLMRQRYLKDVGKEALDDQQMESYLWEKDMGPKMLQLYAMYSKEWDKDLKVIGVEEDWEVPLGFSIDGVPVVFRFRTDLRAEDGDGLQWLIDHKTTARMSESVDHLQLDPQMGKYLWGLRALGHPAVGAIYNEQYKGYPAPPARLKQPRKGLIFSTNKQLDTTYDLYMQTLIEVGEPIEPYQEFLDYLKSSGAVKQWVRRTKIVRNQHELDAVGQMILDNTLDMLDEPRIYPDPTKFKCDWCMVRKVCLAMNDGSDWQWILDNQYRKATTHYDHAV